jgi:neutral trehalase
MNGTRKFAPTKEDFDTAHRKTVENTTSLYLRKLAEKKDALARQTLVRSYFEELPNLRKFQCKPTESSSNKQTTQITNILNTNILNIIQTDKPVFSDEFFYDITSSDNKYDDNELKNIIEDLKKSPLKKITDRYRDLLFDIIKKAKSFFIYND